MKRIRNRLKKLRVWPVHSLTGRLLLLTCAFVLIGEAVIYVFSIGSYHRELLDDYILSAESAALPFTPLSKGGAREEKGAWFNMHGGFRSAVMETLKTDAVVLIWPDRKQLFPSPKVPRKVDLYIDLRHSSTFQDIVHGFDCLLFGGDRSLYLEAKPRYITSRRIDVVITETSLHHALEAHSRRIALFALILTLITTLPLWWCLHVLLIAPIEKIIRGMERFRENPEDARRIFQPSAAKDEIGQAERELAAMQRDLHQSLNRKARLAALGGAVARIQHDLRNMLASAQLISDRLTASEDPKVRKSAPNLITAIDRATELARTTVKYAQSEQPPFHASRFALATLVDDVAKVVPRGAQRLRNHVPIALAIDADREHLFRVLLNLTGNALDAVKAQDEGMVSVTAWREENSICVDVTDNGPGLPEAILSSLFHPFAPSAKGGTGLGLAIASELVRGHGGNLRLIASGEDGTRFRITLPDDQ